MKSAEVLWHEVMSALDDIDFKTPQLNVSFGQLKDGIAEKIVEHCINLPWEEWADDDN